MSLLNKFSNKTTLELVTIIESGDDYTDPAKEAAKTILELKKIEEEELKDASKKFWTDKLNDNFKRYLLNNIKPESKFLNTEEISELFKIAFEKWQEQQETFQVDTTKYWFV